MTPSPPNPTPLPGGELVESAEELYELAPCGYLTTSADGRILRVNRTFAEWLGYSQEELTGAKRLTDLLTVGGRIFYETHLSVLLRMQNSVDEIALDFLCKDGRALPTLVNARQKRNPAGEPILNRYTVFNASERRFYERQLLATRDLLQTTLSSIGDGVIVTDAEARITFMNPVAEELSGWSNEEASGKEIDEVLTLRVEDSTERIENPILRALRDRVIVGLANHTVLIARNGTEIAIDDSAAPIRAADSEVTGAVLVFRDISTRRKGERDLAEQHDEFKRKAADLQNVRDELQRQVDDLRRSNADLSQFAHTASHDLRSPLSTIVQFSQLLERRHGAELGEGRQLLGHVTNAARRMAALIKDLLSYATASVDASQAPVAVDANIAFDSAIANLNSLIESSGAAITRDDLPFVQINETSLAQVFQNLIGNAILYRSAVTPKIHISVSDRGEFWQFACQDNGMGIAPEYHFRIFEAFKRLHGPDIEGSGIGLAICRGTIEKYQGKIWVESQVGEGATFYFTLRKSS